MNAYASTLYDGDDYDVHFLSRSVYFVFNLSACSLISSSLRSLRTEARSPSFAISTRNGASRVGSVERFLFGVVAFLAGLLPPPQRVRFASFVSCPQLSSRDADQLCHYPLNMAGVKGIC